MNFPREKLVYKTGSRSVLNQRTQIKGKGIIRCILSLNAGQVSCVVSVKGGIVNVKSAVAAVTTNKGVVSSGICGFRSSC